MRERLPVTPSASERRALTVRVARTSPRRRMDAPSSEASSDDAESICARTSSAPIRSAKAPRATPTDPASSRARITVCKESALRLLKSTGLEKLGVGSVGIRADALQSAISSRKNVLRSRSVSTSPGVSRMLLNRISRTTTLSIAILALKSGPLDIAALISPISTMLFPGADGFVT